MLLLRFYFMVRAPEHIFHDVRRKKPVSVTALLLVNLDFYSDEKLPGKYLLFPPPHGVLGPHLFLLASEATRQTPLHLSDQNIKTPPSQRDDPLSSAGAYLVPGTWYLVPFFSETRYLFLRWARCRARHACKYTQKQVAGLFTGHAWPHPLVGSGSFQKLRGRVGCSKGSVGLGLMSTAQQTLRTRARPDPTRPDLRLVKSLQNLCTSPTDYCTGLLCTLRLLLC